MNAEQTLDALPVRRRDVLEIFDTSIKLYKRYFWVLLAWAAIANVVSTGISFVPIIGIWISTLIGLFLTPPQVGSVACCVAAAVRGQNITFGQCWTFTRPRYWAIFGQSLLALIIAGVCGLMLVAGTTVLVVGAVAGVATLNLPLALNILLGILGIVVLGVLWSLIFSVAWGWVCMAPLVASLEDSHRNTLALSRTWALMGRNWWRLTGLYTIMGLAVCALMMMLGGGFALLAGVDQLRNIMEGNPPTSDTVMAGVYSFTVISVLLTVLAMPFVYLVTAVLYLDLRVRKEALDLEWTAHVTQPEAATPAGPETTPQYHGLPQETVSGTATAAAAMPAEPTAAVLTPAVVAPAVETSFGASPPTSAGLPIAPNQERYAAEAEAPAPAAGAATAWQQEPAAPTPPTESTVAVVPTPQVAPAAYAEEAPGFPAAAGIAAAPSFGAIPDATAAAAVPTTPAAPAAAPAPSPAPAPAAAPGRPAPKPPEDDFPVSSFGA